MSASRRRTPIFGNCSCASEKNDKAKAHRVERRAVRIALRSDDDDIPSPKAFGNPWQAGKDGKRWWAKAGPEEMRK